MMVDVNTYGVHGGHRAHLHIPGPCRVLSLTWGCSGPHWGCLPPAQPLSPEASARQFIIWACGQRQERFSFNGFNFTLFSSEMGFLSFLSSSHPLS